MSKAADYRLLLTDAFEWLAECEAESIQAIVTDPPYGVLEYMPDQLDKQRNGNGGIWRLPQSYDGQKRQPMPRFTVLRPEDHIRIQKFHRRLAPLLYRVLVPGSHIIMSSQNLLAHFVVSEFSAAGFEIRGQIARVVKTLRGGDRPKGAHEDYPEVSVTPRSNWEPWLIFRKPCEGRVRDNLDKWGTGALRRPLKDRPFSDLIVSSPARGVERKIAPHPSLKPQSFMRQVVRAALPLEKGTILDPFMGSGATISAASSLELKSIGLEIDQEYFTVAEQAIPELAKLQIASSVRA